MTHLAPLVLILIAPVSLMAQTTQPAVPRTPVLTGESWLIAPMPDLGELAGPEPRKQQVVDHGFLRADDGTWQLWACIRGTTVSRLLYRWEGETLEEGPWSPRGIAARADAAWGEPVKQSDDGGVVETIGAPFLARFDGTAYCFYHAGGIRLMTSPDGGRTFERTDLGNGRRNLLYPDGGRDVMVLKVGDTFHAYSTVTTPDRTSYVLLKTSQDMLHWTGHTIAQRGGRGGSGPVDAESPFVVALDGYYYLFRASSITFKTYVYRSTDPADFGIDSDEKLIAELPLKAPEVIHHDGKWSISDLADFQGIRLHRLEWREDAAE